MFIYKIDVLAAIKAAGITTTAIRKGAMRDAPTLLGESAVQKLREGRIVGIKALDQICTLLHCQPGDIIEWIPDTKKEGE